MSLVVLCASCALQALQPWQPDFHLLLKKFHQWARYRLHFFPQYSYLQKRIDWIRGRAESDDKRMHKRSVIVLGTPGIGKRRSTC